MMNGPDGLTGAIMAVESIPGASVLLHGPAGCRVRNALLSMALVPREDRGWGDYAEPHYAGYSRVPASYIDSNELIEGAVGKLGDALAAVTAKEGGLVVVMDSPSAAIMADDHMSAVKAMGIGDRVMVLDMPTMSEPPVRTYGRTVCSVLRHLVSSRRELRPGTVNLLGLTVGDAFWEEALEELGAYIRDMGLELACAPGAGASVEDLRRSADSEFCAVVCIEACEGLAELYGSMGLVVFVPGAGAPVGFDATRSWIEGLAEAAGRDPSRALERLRRKEAKAASRLEGMRYGMMRVRGMTFSAAAPSSVLAPLATWLNGYLSMVPVTLVPEGRAEGLADAVSSIGFPESVSDRLCPADVVFCDGNTALRMESGGRCLAAVSTGWAVIGSDGLMPRPMYGALGAVHILDSIVRASRGRP